MRSTILGLVWYSLVGVLLWTVTANEESKDFVVVDNDIGEKLEEVVVHAEPVPSTIQRNNSPIVRTDTPIEHVDIDVFCLAKNIFHEAGIEPEEGKYAVAQVTLNRVDNPKYPNTICEVVMDPYQFSWTNDRSKRWTRPKGPNWEESKRIAEKVIHQGYRYQGLENVSYYHADYVQPKWALAMDVRGQVGRHIFYERRAY